MEPDLECSDPAVTGLRTSSTAAPCELCCQLECAGPLWPKGDERSDSTLHAAGEKHTTLRVLAVELVIRTALAVLGLYHFWFCPPFVRRIWPTDWEYYSFPFVEQERFSLGRTLVYSNLTALACLALGLASLKAQDRRRGFLRREAAQFLLGGSLAVICGFVACEITKRLYGQPRPDFVARCLGPRRWRAFQKNAPWGGRSLEEIPDCSASPFPFAVVEDGRMSFPSEHACLTTCLIGFAALWVRRCISLMRQSWVRGASLQIAVPFALVVFPLVVSLSRISDYRHHPSDVAGGALIGLLIAFICFHFYFDTNRQVGPGEC